MGASDPLLSGVSVQIGSYRVSLQQTQMVDQDLGCSPDTSLRQLSLDKQVGHQLVEAWATFQVSL